MCEHTYECVYNLLYFHKDFKVQNETNSIILKLLTEVIQLKLSNFES